MLDESFAQEYRADGWRYSVAYRTRPWNIYGDHRILWPVERWDGENWISVGNGSSYADARRIATEDSK